MDPDRRSNTNLAVEEAILWQIEQKTDCRNISKLPVQLHMKTVEPEEAPTLADLYAGTFDTYPTPVTDPEYLGKTMGTGTVYIGVYDHGRMISAASGIIDRNNLAAEISDCATHPEYRGMGLMQILIAAVETELSRRGVIALYSLARAMSPGMNSVLYKSGYTFRGRFINNCHICGRFEDMNLWTKGYGTIMDI